MVYVPQVVPLSPVNEALIADAGAFADEVLRPQAEKWERQRTQPSVVLRDAISRFTPTAIAGAVGGFGSNSSTMARIYEELSRRDLGFTCALAVHSNVTTAVALTGNAALRERFLPGLLSGENLGAFLLTEPQAGSDATAIATTAEKTAGGYRVNGRKAWVTNGANADVLAVFAQTQPGGGAGGIAGLLFDARSPGVTATPMLDLFGSHAMGTTDVIFENAEIDGDPVAFAAGDAFKAGMYAINVARLGVAAMCNGALWGALDTAVAYAGERKTFGKPLIQHQGLQWILADVATQLEASRALTFQAARLFDAGKDATVLAAHAKKYATVAAFDGISQCMRALGANGLKREHGLARQLAAARVTECMDGTGEVQNIVLGRALQA